MKATIVCILIISFFTSSQVNGKKNNCRNWRNQIDLFASKLLMVGDRSLIIPKDVNEVSTIFCPKIRQNIEQVKEIARSCLKPFPKQLVGVILFAIKKVNRDICSSTKEKEFIASSLECVQDVNRMESVHELMDDFVRFSHFVHRNISDVNKKIPFICCQYLKFLHKLEKRLTPWCKREAIDYVVNMIQKMMVDATDIICPTYTRPGSYSDPNGRCYQFLQNHPVNINSSSRLETLSVLPPLVDIFSEMGSLPEEYPQG